MKRLDVVIELERVREAKKAWATAQTEVNAGLMTVMSRLLHEAARNFMSPEDIAKSSGFTPKRVRQMMRDINLNPRNGKTVLSQTAAEALANNAALLGIEPREMDLLSPLAYLPMGSQMRKDLAAGAVERANAEVSGNTYHEAKPRILASLYMGIAAEEDWDGPSVKPGDLTEEQIDWLASWLAGDGIK